MKMTEAEVVMYHHAAKSIEADGCGAYWTVRTLYGENVAGALLVLFLRMEMGKGQWPPADDLIERVNAVLEEDHILKKE